MSVFYSLEMDALGGGIRGMGMRPLGQCCSSGLSVIVEKMVYQANLRRGKGAIKANTTRGRVETLQMYKGGEGATRAQGRTPSALTTHYFKGTILKIMCYNYVHLVLHV